MTSNTTVSKCLTGRKDKQVESFWSSIFKQFRKNKLAVVSFYVLLVIILACIFVPIFSPYTMEQTNMQEKSLPPSAAHWFGTDDIGRDLFTRLFVGGRISLGISLAVVALECVIGILLGTLAGYYGGFVDGLIMRIADIFLCFPFLIICITIVSIFSSGPVTLIVTLAVLSWPSIARIVRAQILSLRELEYMEACEALGISDSRRMFRHLLPNVMAYVIVYATLGIAGTILTETSLSFLGMGIRFPIPTWGNLIQAARNPAVLDKYWWYWVPSGVAIFLTVMCWN
ncbi:MAG TPA: ABC transporter permease, partial [Bacillota bacterium]|nr:ABC transporter permease [Bacillota bacterium]